FWPRHREQVLRLPGVVEIQEVRLGSKIGGRVEKVAIREGDLVDAGRPLVYFAMPEMEAQREQYQAALDTATADLEKARNGPRPEEKRAADAAVEAARARWKLLKAGSRPEEIAEARSQFASAQAELKLARERFDRTERLYRQGPSSREEYEAARSGLDNAQA